MTSLQTGLDQGVKRCGHSRTALNRFELVEFVQCGHVFLCAFLYVQVHQVYICLNLWEMVLYAVGTIKVSF